MILGVSYRVLRRESCCVIYLVEGWHRWSWPAAQAVSWGRESRASSHCVDWRTRWAPVTLTRTTARSLRHAFFPEAGAAGARSWDHRVPRRSWVPGCGSVWTAPLWSSGCPGANCGRSGRNEGEGEGEGVMGVNSACIPLRLGTGDVPLRAECWWRCGDWAAPPLDRRTEPG